MAGKNSNELTERDAKKEEADNRLQKIAKLAINTDDGGVAMRLLNQSFGVMREGVGGGGPADTIGGMIPLIQGFKPKDNFERMLSAQALGAHEAAMECLRRANLSCPSSDNLRQ